MIQKSWELSTPGILDSDKLVVPIVFYFLDPVAWGRILLFVFSVEFRGSKIWPGPKSK